MRCIQSAAALSCLLSAQVLAQAAEAPPQDSASSTQESSVEADLISDLLVAEDSTPAADTQTSSSGNERPPSESEAAAATEIPSLPVATEPKPQDPAPPTRAKPGNRLVEEIVVTAQKREESLQDVPVSVQAFSGGNLEARGVTDATDLPRITPGLTITQAVGFTLIFLRGVGSDAFLLGDPSVAYYVDDIYFPFAQGLAQDFGAVERIEVLKGPQGTLFGRNAVGGAVNVLTKAPQFGERFTSVESSFGNYNTIKNRVHTNIPLGDSAALAVSAFYNTQDFYQNGRAGVVAGEPESGYALDPIVGRAVRVKLRMAPTEDLDVTVAGLRYLSQGAGTLFQLNQYPSPLAASLGVQPNRGYNGELDEPTYQTIDNTVAYGDIKWHLPWVDLRLLGSSQLIETGAAYDYDGSSQPIVGFDGPALYADVQSGEFQVLSNGEWGPEWLDWILGSYYFQSKAGYDGGLRQKGSRPDDLSSALRALLPPSIPAPLLPTGNIMTYGQLGTRSLAWFTQGTARFNETFSMTLGARYQSEKRYVIEAYNALENDDGSTTPFYPSDPGSNLMETMTESFSPKVSLEARLLDDMLLFLSYQTATKSATFNPLKVAQPVDQVKPEETTAYELGMKTSLFDGLVTLSSALFYYDIQDLQVQYVSILNGGVVTFQTAPGAQVKGVDFDLSAVLFPDHVENLAMTLGGAFLDARFTRFPNGSGFDPGTGLFSQNNDFTGNRISRAPRFTGTATLSKIWSVPGGSLELAGDYYYNSGFFYTAQNSPTAEQGRYDLLGARISYLYEPWGLRATVFGNNILDEYYSIGVLQADFGTNVSLGAPVTYGLRLAWDF